MPIAERTIKVDGLNVRYLEAGSGPAVIMLHGASLGSSAEAFEEVVEPVAEGGFRAIAYDQPGYGLTDNPRDYRLSYRIPFVTQFMDALGIDRATLVGHSQAGGIVLRVAIGEPERVAGVVVVCSGSVLPPLPGGTPAAPGGEPASGADPSLEDVRRMVEADLYHKELATDEVVAARHRLSTGKNVVAAVERSKAREAGEGGPLMWERLAEIEAPLLLMYGDHDRARAGERATLFKQQYPELDVRVVNDAAHMLMADAPQAFVDGVRDVLRATANV